MKQNWNPVEDVGKAEEHLHSYISTKGPFPQKKMDQCKEKHSNRINKMIEKEKGKRKKKRRKKKKRTNDPQHDRSGKKKKPPDEKKSRKLIVGQKSENTIEDIKVKTPKEVFKSVRKRHSRVRVKGGVLPKKKKKGRHLETFLKKDVKKRKKLIMKKKQNTYPEELNDNLLDNDINNPLAVLYDGLDNTTWALSSQGNKTRIKEPRGRARKRKRSRKIMKGGVTVETIKHEGPGRRTDPTLISKRERIQKIENQRDNYEKMNELVVKETVKFLGVPQIGVSEIEFNRDHRIFQQIESCKNVLDEYKQSCELDEKIKCMPREEWDIMIKTNFDGVFSINKKNYGNNFKLLDPHDITFDRGLMNKDIGVVDDAIDGYDDVNSFSTFRSQRKHQVNTLNQCMNEVCKSHSKGFPNREYKDVKFLSVEMTERYLGVYDDSDVDSSGNTLGPVCANAYQKTEHDTRYKFDNPKAPKLNLCQYFIYTNGKHTGISIPGPRLYGKGHSFNERKPCLLCRWFNIAKEHCEKQSSGISSEYTIQEYAQLVNIVMTPNGERTFDPRVMIGKTRKNRGTVAPCFLLDMAHLVLVPRHRMKKDGSRWLPGFKFRDSAVFQSLSSRNPRHNKTVNLITSDVEEVVTKMKKLNAWDLLLGNLKTIKYISTQIKAQNMPTSSNLYHTEKEFEFFEKIITKDLYDKNVCKSKESLREYSIKILEQYHLYVFIPYLKIGDVITNIRVPKTLDQFKNMKISDFALLTKNIIQYCYWNPFKSTIGLRNAKVIEFPAAVVMIIRINMILNMVSKMHMYFMDDFDHRKKSRVDDINFQYNFMDGLYEKDKENNKNMNKERMERERRKKYEHVLHFSNENVNVTKFSNEHFKLYYDMKRFEKLYECHTTFMLMTESVISYGLDYLKYLNDPRFYNAYVPSRMKYEYSPYDQPYIKFYQEKYPKKSNYEEALDIIRNDKNIKKLFENFNFMGLHVFDLLSMEVHEMNTWFLERVIKKLGIGICDEHKKKINPLKNWKYDYYSLYREEKEKEKENNSNKQSDISYSARVEELVEWLIKKHTKHFLPLSRDSYEKIKIQYNLFVNGKVENGDGNDDDDDSEYEEEKDRWEYLLPIMDSDYIEQMIFFDEDEIQPENLINAYDFKYLDPLSCSSFWTWLLRVNFLQEIMCRLNHRKGQTAENIVKHLIDVKTDYFGDSEFQRLSERDKKRIRRQKKNKIGGKVKVEIKHYEDYTSEVFLEKVLFANSETLTEEMEKLDTKIKKIEYYMYITLNNHLDLGIGMFSRQRFDDGFVFGNDLILGIYDKLNPCDSLTLRAETMPIVGTVFNSTNLDIKNNKGDGFLEYMYNKPGPFRCQIRRIVDLILKEYKNGKQNRRYIFACCWLTIMGLYEHANHYQMAKNYPDMLNNRLLYFTQCSVGGISLSERRDMLFEGILKSKRIVRDIIKENTINYITKYLPAVCKYYEEKWDGVPYIKWEEYKNSCFINMNIFRTFFAETGEFPSEKEEIKLSQIKKIKEYISENILMMKRVIVKETRDEIRQTKNKSKKRQLKKNVKYLKGMLNSINNEIMKNKSVIDKTGNRIRTTNLEKIINCDFMKIEVMENKKVSRRQKEIFKDMVEQIFVGIMDNNEWLYYLYYKDKEISKSLYDYVDYLVKTIDYKTAIMFGWTSYILRGFMKNKIMKKIKPGQITTKRPLPLEECGLYRLFQYGYVKTILNALMGLFKECSSINILKKREIPFWLLKEYDNEEIISKIEKYPKLGKLSEDYFKYHEEVFTFLHDECGLSILGLYVLTDTIYKYKLKKSENKILYTIRALKRAYKDYPLILYYFTKDHESHTLRFEDDNVTDYFKIMPILKKNNKFWVNPVSVSNEVFQNRYGYNIEKYGRLNCVTKNPFNLLYAKCCRRIANYSYYKGNGNHRISGCLEIENGGTFLERQKRNIECTCNEFTGNILGCPVHNSHLSIKTKHMCANFGKKNKKNMITTKRKLELQLQDLVKQRNKIDPNSSSLRWFNEQHNMLESVTDDYINDNGIYLGDITHSSKYEDVIKDNRNVVNDGIMTIFGKGSRDIFESDDSKLDDVQEEDFLIGNLVNKNAGLINDDDDDVNMFREDDDDDDENDLDTKMEDKKDSYAHHKTEGKSEKEKKKDMGLEDYFDDEEYVENYVPFQFNGNVNNNNNTHSFLLSGGKIKKRQERKSFSINKKRIGPGLLIMIEKFSQRLFKKSTNRMSCHVQEKAIVEENYIGGKLVNIYSSKEDIFSLIFCVLCGSQVRKNNYLYYGDKYMCENCHMTTPNGCKYIMNIHGKVIPVKMEEIVQFFTSEENDENGKRKSKKKEPNTPRAKEPATVTQKDETEKGVKTQKLSNDELKRLNQTSIREEQEKKMDGKRGNRKQSITPELIEFCMRRAKHTILRKKFYSDLYIDDMRNPDDLSGGMFTMRFVEAKGRSGPYKYITNKRGQYTDVKKLSDVLKKLDMSEAGLRKANKDLIKVVKRR